MKAELFERDLSKVPAEKICQLIINSETKLSDLIPTKKYEGELEQLMGGFDPTFTLNIEY